jgi:hypothetical protein
MKDKYVKVCPRCGSSNFKNLLENAGYLFGGRGMDYQYVCLDCNNTGIFVDIDKDQLENFREELKKNQKTKVNKENAKRK